MSIAPVPFREAATRQRDKDVAHWPSRGAPNRLEPECWPVIRPSFTVAPGATVFTMGSCFARNIENHLDRLGFVVPAVRLTRAAGEQAKSFGSELFNKYTPTSIAQELAWARAIRDRDDTVREEDVLPLLLDLGKDRYIDLHARADPGYGLPLAEQMARRRLIYAVSRTAFDCDLAVVTLGLIETWWDDRTGQSIEVHARAVRHPDSAHFSFRPLDYPEALAAVERALALLLENPRTKVLLTTSPIPLSSTFTGDDVIVANMMSKSVLRAVAGAVTRGTDRVDYFPSYESVMLTKQASVWRNDLIHVEEAFIGRVMARVVGAYVDGAATDQYEAAMTFSNLVRGKVLDAAAEHYPLLRDLPPDPRLPALPLDLATYEISVDDHERARQRLRSLVVPDDASFGLHLGMAWLLQSLGDDAEAERHRALGFAMIANNWVIVHNMLASTRQNDQLDEHRLLLAKAEAAFADNGAALARLAGFRREDGDTEGYHRVMRQLIATHATTEQIVRYAQEFLSAGDRDTALEIVSHVAEPETSTEASLQIASIAMWHGRYEHAIATLRRRLAVDRDDARAAGQYALALSHTGQDRAALRAARRAIDLNTPNAQVAKLAERLERKLGRAAPMAEDEPSATP